jgi:hypothetical protein
MISILPTIWKAGWRLWPGALESNQRNIQTPGRAVSGLSDGQINDIQSVSVQKKKLMILQNNEIRSFSDKLQDK